MPIAIIVPTLEEVDNIVPLVEQIEQTKVPFSEIIFVDDGSIDGTREKIRALATAHRVRLIEREGAERGLAGAIIAGANASSLASSSSSRHQRVSVWTSFSISTSPGFLNWPFPDPVEPNDLRNAPAARKIETRSPCSTRRMDSVPARDAFVRTRLCKRSRC